MDHFKEEDYDHLFENPHEKTTDLTACLDLGTSQSNYFDEIDFGASEPEPTLDDPAIFRLDGLYQNNEQLNNLRTSYLIAVSESKNGQHQEMETARRNVIDMFNVVNAENLVTTVQHHSFADMNNQDLVKNFYAIFRGQCFATLEKCYNEETEYPYVFRKEQALRIVFYEWMRTRAKVDHFELKNFLKYGYGECDVEDQEDDEEDIEELIMREMNKPLESETLTMHGQIKAQKKLATTKKRPIRSFFEQPNLNGMIPFNPVSMRFKFEPGNPANAASPTNIIEYEVHVEEKKKGMVVYIPKKNIRTAINRKDVLNWNDLKWELPLVGGVHRVTPTPRTAYKVTYPEDIVVNEKTDTRFEKRWFQVINKMPTNQFEQVTISVMGVDSVSTLSKVITDNELKVAVMPKKVRNKIVKMDVVYKELMQVRKVFEAHGYQVCDDIVKERRIDIKTMKYEELEQRAEKYVKEQLKKKVRYEQIINKEKLKQPMWSFVVRQMHKEGRIDDEVLKKFSVELYEKPPKLTADQYIQAYDAYYWVNLAPQGKKKPEFKSILDCYKRSGIIITLIGTYLRTGASRGRSSASGELRKFRGARAPVYDKLPSKHITEDDEHKKVAVKPVPRESKSLYNYVKADSDVVFTNHCGSDTSKLVEVTKVIKRPRIEFDDDDDSEDNPKAPKRSREEWLNLSDENAIDDLANCDDPDLQVLDPECEEDMIIIGKKKKIFAQCNELVDRKREVKKEYKLFTEKKFVLVGGGSGKKKRILNEAEQAEALKLENELKYIEQRLVVLRTELLEVTPRIFRKKYKDTEMEIILNHPCNTFHTKNEPAEVDENMEESY